ncbi:MAG: PAS domain S-box protein [Chloroflexota bacterium]
MTIESNQPPDSDADVIALRQRVAELEQQLARTQVRDISVEDSDYFFTRSPDMLCVASFDGYFQRLNPSWERILGFTNEELCAVPFIEFVHPDDRERTLMEAQKVAGGSQTIAFENRYRCKDESYKWLRWSSTSVAQTGRIYAIVRDITDQKQAELTLATSLQKLELQFQQTPLAIIEWDLDFNVSEWNPAAERIFGYTRTEAIGKHVAELIVPAEAREYVDAIWRDLLQNEGGTRSTNANFTKSGRNIMCEWYNTSLVASDGTVLGVSSLVQDVTAQLEAEREREELQNQIIETQQAALRELNTPLIPLADNVVAMPLIGTIDSNRAQQMIETLLEGITKYQAAVAILDVTGVPLVDTQIADALIRASRAAQLIGSQIVLTGIGPEVAQTLVTIGVDLSDIVTHSNIQNGIAYALKQTNS